MKYETSGNDKACSSVASSFNTEVSDSTMIHKEDEVKEKMNDLSIQYDDSTNKYDQFEGDEVCSRDGESNKIRVPLTLDMLPQILLPDDFLRLPSTSSISPSNYSGFRYTVTLQKDSKVGLGMTIRDSYILRNIPTDKVRTAVVVANLDFEGSPARLSGVKLDDVLEEVNGTKVFSVRQAASIIRSLSPKCHPKLSFVRGLNCELQSNDISKTNEHIKNTQHKSTVLSAHSASRYKGHHLTHSNKIVEKQPFHPILILLQSRNLVPSSVLSKEEMLKSSSMIKYYSRFESSVSYTRMPLCIRILHQFDDPEGHGIAYTIWVYDVSTGKEWFAPTRFYRDFVDLRTHSIRLCSKISKFSLNKEISGLFQWNANDEYDPNERAILLESFLRDVCTFLYVSCNDDHGIADAALHLRSFLGCDEDVFNSSPTRKQRIGSPSNKDDVCTHRTVQLYVYLLFTLPPFQYLISSFIEETRKRISEIFETANAGRRTTRWLKVVSKGELKRVGICLNQLTDMILEGCKCDISQFRRNAESDHHYPHPSIAIAVREQVEIEVYVPLRSLLSKALVNAYRHEDLEVYYKIKQLKEKPQSYFGVLEQNQSPTNWRSVSNIIKEDLCRATLPCLKMQAVIESAKEITRLHSVEHSNIEQPQDASNVKESNDQINSVIKANVLGADDFLPIYIFCIIRSEMERPCALMALLSGLYDSSKGEGSYYLATLHAAISHIQEQDLQSENQHFI